MNFPWWSGDVPRLPSYGIDISQLVRFARCCTSVFDFHSKNLQITSKLLTQGYRYHKLQKKHLESSLEHTLNFCRNLVIFRSKNICQKESLTRSSTVIIERTKGLVLGPFTALYRLFLKYCTLTNKAVGTICRALSKPPQRRQGPDLCYLWLLVGTPSAIIPELAFSRAEHSRPYSDVAKYIFDIQYLLPMLFVYWFLLPLRLVWLLVCCLYKEVYLQIFKCMSFWLHGCCS